MKTGGADAERVELAMSSEEKPLHVRVAEALGCKPEKTPGGWYCRCGKWGESHGAPDWGGILHLYDTDWSATGPLIEKYHITLESDWCDGPIWWASRWQEWDEMSEKRDHPDLLGGCAYPDGPLVAVCNLLLALKEAGKL